MNKVLRAIIISSCATVAAGIALQLFDRQSLTDPPQRERLPSGDPEFGDLSKEQTEALMTELASQV
ncbi:MAG: hypothetical protein HKN43_07430 [Rhodothermales bacterium]|nr:hypothetical protein [Rhodothermales bacterium]